MDDVLLRRFDTPDEVRAFEKGRFELVGVGGLTLGRAPGHDSWVVGDEPYVSLHLMGATGYAHR